MAVGHLFLYSAQTKNFFLHLKWLGKKISRHFLTCENYINIQISVSTDKDLLKHRHTHSFIYYQWLLLYTTPDLSSYESDHMAYKA